MIVATGVIGSRLLYELAIVGGTGLYDNARGSLTVTTYGLGPRTLPAFAAAGLRAANPVRLDPALIAEAVRARG